MKNNELNELSVLRTTCIKKTTHRNELQVERTTH